MKSVHGSLLSLVFLASIVTVLQAQTATPACAGRAGSSTADSTKTIPAESRLIGPNALWDLRPADTSADTVRVRFLVASNGRVAPWTVRVSGTTDKHWMVRARGWLTRTRFRPTLRGRCGVPQWMDLTYASRS
jgi:hypothetical protein